MTDLLKIAIAQLNPIVGDVAGNAAKARAARAEAARLGANAVIGIDLDYEVLGDKNGMLMVTVCGTAVVLDAAR